jgi:hypothetical protein
MRIRIVASATALILMLFLISPAARADTVMFKDGTSVDGVINKVEKGTVYMAIGDEVKCFDILLVESMDFNTPHLATEPSNVPIDHFLNNIDAQEIVRNLKDLESDAAEIRSKLGQIRTYWMGKQPVSSEEVKGWDAAKEDFKKPLSRYQEVLNDLYFHVLARVDEYNLMMNDANKVYVGVKGIKIGSPLVAKEMKKLPLAKYVPGTWYDTIFYEGYNLGYDDGYAKINPSKPD